MVEDLCRRSRGNSAPDLPDSLFGLYAELIDCEMPEDLARELMERVRAETPRSELADAAALRVCAAQIVEREIAVQPPITMTPGRCRVVALSARPAWARPPRLPSWPPTFDCAKSGTSD